MNREDYVRAIIEDAREAETIEGAEGIVGAILDVAISEEILKRGKPIQERFAAGAASPATMRELNDALVELFAIQQAQTDKALETAERLSDDLTAALAENEKLRAEAKGGPRPEDHLALFRKSVERNMPGGEGDAPEDWPWAGEPTPPDDPLEAGRHFYRGLAAMLEHTYGDKLKPPAPGVAEHPIGALIRKTKDVCDEWGLNTGDPWIGTTMLSILMGATQDKHFARRVAPFLAEQFTEANGGGGA